MRRIDIRTNRVRMDCRCAEFDIACLADKVAELGDDQLRNMGMLCFQIRAGLRKSEKAFDREWNKRNKKRMEGSVK